MARRLKQTKRKATGERVRGIEIPSRPLRVIDSAHPIWETVAVGGSPVEGKMWLGAIVWLQAPHDAPEGAEALLAERFRAAGATRVRKLPREQAPLRIQDGDADEEEGRTVLTVSRGTMRETVFEMAREILPSEDERRALEEVLEEALSEAGL